MTISEQRKAFEDYERRMGAKPNFAERDGEEYGDPAVEDAWNFWQAASRETARRCAEIAQEFYFDDKTAKQAARAIREEFGITEETK